MTGQYAQQQKMLLYILPLVFAVGGIAFPIGVLFYWTTSNLWTMGQQFYVIRNNPAPGTPAARAKQDRDAEKRKRKGLPDPSTPIEPTVESTEPLPEPPKRQQPKKQPRSQRKKQPPAGGKTPPGKAASGPRPPEGGPGPTPDDEGDDEEPGRNSA
jgi:YidC/Oxa1 family membrane protein insertase